MPGIQKLVPWFLQSLACRVPNVSGWGKWDGDVVCGFVILTVRPIGIYAGKWAVFFCLLNIKPGEHLLSLHIYIYIFRHVNIFLHVPQKDKELCGICRKWDAIDSNWLCWTQNFLLLERVSLLPLCYCAQASLSIPQSLRHQGWSQRFREICNSFNYIQSADPARTLI